MTRVRRNSQVLMERKTKSGAPTDEMGAPISAATGIAPWGAMFLGDELERVPELQWPNSVLTYNAMRNDAQLEGLMAGTTLPIRNYDWMIDPNGCDMSKVELLAKDLNLPIKGLSDNRGQGRYKDRFNHDKHLYHAMLTLVYGHYFMEQVGEIGTDEYWHIRKLAPRPPATIQQVGVDSKGGLTHIQQNISSTVGATAPIIPVERLVAYVWDQEGANWFGRSMFRSCFRNWLIKDRLLRVDAQKQQRNGMGMPVATGGPGGGKAELLELQKMASSIRSGDQSGVSLPYGSTLTLEGVRGSLPDTIASIRFHNEEMARRFLMMFMQLGESLHGNRALGDSFIEFFQLNQDTVASWYAETTTAHVIEDWWDWNVGMDEEFTPLLAYERDDNPRYAFGELAQLVTAGIIQLDDELEEAVREAMDLPKLDPNATIRVPDVQEPTTNPPANPTTQDKPSPEVKAGRQGRSVGAAAATSPAIPLPDRTLRRKPATYELAAQVDFDLMDRQWQSRLDKLFESWKEQVVPEQLAALEAAIARTSNLKTFATLEAPALGADLLEEAMNELYSQGVSSALAEAANQGVFINEPHPEDYTTGFAARAGAVDEIAARQLGQMAGTRAMRLTGGKMTKSEVAAETRTYMDEIKHAQLRDRLGGALTQAYNTGRRAVMAEGPAASYYASELLDANTCDPCTSVDGTQYSTLSEAEVDYVGGYTLCSGGDRCRGTIVAVYDTGGAEDAA